MNEAMEPPAAESVDEARYERLAEAFAAEGYVLPVDAVVVRGEGEDPGRAILAGYMTPDELESVSRRGRGRPRLSAGAGRSPKRQVRLSEELDAALVRLAQAQGRTPSALVREAVETYVRRSA